MTCFKRLAIISAIIAVASSPMLGTVPSDSATTAGPYACDGSDTTFTFTFGLDTTSDLEVIRITVADGTETPLTLTTHYSITSANTNDPQDYTSGGTVTTTTAYSSEYEILLRRDTTKTQVVNVDDEEIEEALDKLTRIAQDLAERLGRCLQIQPSEAGDTVQFGPDGTAGYAYRAANGNWSVATPSAVDQAVASPYDSIIAGTASDAERLAAKADLHLDGFVDVRDYGATGDGETDDHAAFEAARDAAGPGGTVLITAGTYAFGSAISPGNYVTWQGVGLDSVLHSTSGNTDNAIFQGTTASMGAVRMRDLKFTTDNASAIAIDMPMDHYVNYCTFERCFFSAAFDIGFKGLLGGVRFVDCDFGVDGSPGSTFQAISAQPTTALLNILTTFTNCRFYYGIGKAGTVEIGYANTIKFEHCLWEYNSQPAIDANGVSELILDGCNWEVEEPGGSQNCLINTRYITTLSGVAVGQGCHVKISNSRFTNGGGGSTPWDAIVYAGGSGCWASFSQISGGLGSTWLCKDTSGNYDYAQVLSSRGLRHVDNLAVTGYSGSSVISTITVYDRAASRLIQGVDPALILMPVTATDTRWWQGITCNEDGADNDSFEIGTGTTKGTGTKLGISGTATTVYGKLVQTAYAPTIADSGDGSAATLTLAPTTSLVQLTNPDTDGCTVTLSETGAVNGHTVLVVNVGSNNVTIADSAGVCQLSGGANATLNPGDAIQITYSSTLSYWYQSAPLCDNN